MAEIDGTNRTVQVIDFKDDYGKPAKNQALAKTAFWISKPVGTISYQLWGLRKPRSMPPNSPARTGKA